MERSIIDALKGLQLIYNMRNSGCVLTEEQEEAIIKYSTITDKSPLELILTNNTCGIKPSEIIEFLNL